MFSKRFFSLLLFLGVFFLSVQRVAAASYYVDSKEGHDDYSGDEENTAWQTLTPLRNINLEPGDTVYFKRGSSWDTGYAYGRLSSNLGLVIDNSGTETHPITFTTYGEGSPPVFTNSYAALPYTRAFTIQGSHIRMENLTIKDVKEAGIYLNSSATYVTLDSLDISRTAYAIVILGNHNVISNSKLHDTLMMANNEDNGDNDIGAAGVLLWGSDNIIHHNTIENNLQHSYDYGTYGSAIELYSEAQPIERNIIQHNIIRNNNAVTNVGGYGHPTFRDNVFAYNLLVNNSRLATLHNGGYLESTVENLKFHNNTVYENTTEWSGIGATRSKDSFITFIAAPESSALELRNNIFWVRGISTLANFKAFTHDYNLYYLHEGTAPITLNPSERMGVPLFISTGATKNFHLQSNSPARNAGTRLGYIHDLDNKAVPYEEIPDLGAYEYTLGVASPPHATSPSPSPVIASIGSTDSDEMCTATPDINADGKVNVFDFVLMSEKFFQTDDIVAVDLNCDAKVNVFDFAILSSAFAL